MIEQCNCKLCSNCRKSPQEFLSFVEGQLYAIDEILELFEAYKEEKYYARSKTLADAIIGEMNDYATELTNKQKDLQEHIKLMEELKM